MKEYIRNKLRKFLEIKHSNLIATPDRCLCETCKLWRAYGYPTAWDALDSALKAGQHYQLKGNLKLYNRECVSEDCKIQRPHLEVAHIKI